ncbi:hypothetical protein COEREDRAFT_79144 [Coemansia reversa NRRL 1564]|uniref:Uncharacterized protein n=1 Tax=Coemansia reversa (strain ATCC 12441 / NRRL 1564) TaxID=763665 RepID=A0A2G5BJM3_COERN|nr:hypothetical protein COEREDRAFT_79144 [Coemansia reversa NRRL 1564]|eukprot:PIA19181.1 hypothetical protein COEREDRAFT_79144 [Coemansia reversa NRRL 1564]
MVDIDSALASLVGGHDQSLFSQSNPLFSRSEFTGLFVLNSISIVCSLFVAVFIHMYHSDLAVLAATRPQQHWQQRELKRSQRQRSILRPIGTQAKMYLSLPAPLRLLFIASIVDVLYSVFRMYYLGVSTAGFSGDHQANCKASMTGVSFFNLLSVFVRALLSVHLQLVVLNNVGRALHYERHFLFAAVVISAVLSVLPVFTGNYVWLRFDPTMGSAHCGYFPLQRTTDNMSDVPGENIWTERMAQAAMRKGLAIMWATNFAWLTMTVTYGAVVIVSVMIRLFHRRHIIKKIDQSQDMIIESAQHRREFLHMATRVVRRILQFPLMVFVCHILEVVYGMVTLSRALQLIHSDSLSTSSSATIEANKSLTRLYLASHVMLGMEGIITLFFLPLEPPIRLMLRSMYLRQRSELHRLGTVSRSAPRRKPSERWPTARTQTGAAIQSQYTPSIESSTLSSFTRSSEQQMTVSADKAIAELPDALQTQALCSPLPVPINTVPTIAHTRRNSVYAAQAALSVVVDHFVTHARCADDPCNNARSSSAPLRRITQKWLRRSQRNVANIPEPVHRSKTLDELPWDIVSVPRRRSLTGSLVMQPAAHTNAANAALALRNDGLSTVQWYVPHAPKDPDNDAEYSTAANE